MAEKPPRGYSYKRENPERERGRKTGKKRPEVVLDYQESLVVPLEHEPATRTDPQQDQAQ